MTSLHREIGEAQEETDEHANRARAEIELPQRLLGRGEGGGEHEQVMEIIESIRHNRGRVYSANLPNRGQVDNIPEGAVLESPAVASAEGLRPIRPSQLRPAQAAVIRMRLEAVEAIVEAALEGSRTKFVQALVIDGAVAGVSDAEKLADELLKAQAAHLQWYK